MTTKGLLFLLFALTFSSLLQSCGNSPEENHDPSNNDSEAPLTVDPSPNLNASLSEIHFYYENSHSMDGYFNEGSSFNNNVYRLMLDFKQKYKFNGYFINDTIYEQKDLISRFAEKNLETDGMFKSNHQYIYSRAIRTSGGSKMSVVVTDGIYSIKGKDLDIVSLDIENDFYSSLEMRKIDMAVIKFESSFSGKYYFEKCETKVQELNDVIRPYYIILFAEKSVLDQALEKHFDTSSHELKGFVDIARFFRYESEKASFTLLEDGEEKIGKFHGLGNNFTYDAIEVSKKELLANGEKGIQFAIAVDFSGLSVPNSYILNIDNYKLNGGDYKLINVFDLSKLDKFSISMKEIRDIQDADESLNFTHMLVLNGEKDLFDTVQVKLINKMPSWIVSSSIETDCEIENLSNKTITFYELMKGINNAYNKVNNRAHFVSLKFEVKS